MNLFTLIFLAALLLSSGIQLWLAQRHIRHIQVHRHEVPADFAENIDLSAHQLAADYTTARTRLGMVHTIFEAALLLLLTLGGVLAALQRFWLAHFGNPLVSGTLLIASVVLLVSLLEMPFRLYRTFGIDARYGFNRMTPAVFVADLLKAALLAIVLGLPLLLGFLWIMEKMGPYWWLYAWLAWSAFNLLMLGIFPTYIAPLFNKFTPLQDQALRERIERLLQRCGFQSQGLFVMDGSKRSSHGNAYFTGLGKSKRIVFFDTLLARLSADEIEAVLAHELGHFKRRHIVKRIAWMFVMSLAGLWLLGWLMGQAWFYTGLGVPAGGTAMALLLFMQVSPVFTFLFHPLGSYYSRKHEFEADAYAASVANASDLIRSLVKLYKDNASTLTPDPLHSLFYDSHPPAAIRIDHLRRQGAA